LEICIIILYIIFACAKYFKMSFEASQSLLEVTPLFLPTKTEMVTQEDENEINKWLENESILPTGSLLSIASSPISSPQHFSPPPSDSPLLSTSTSTNSSPIVPNSTSTTTAPPQTMNVPSFFTGMNFSSPLMNGFNFGYSFPQVSGTTIVNGNLPPPMEAVPQQGSNAFPGQFANPAFFPSGQVPLNIHPSLLHMFAFNTFQQFLQNNGSKSSGDDSEENKKRRQSRTLVRRVRQTRPKVVEGKGAIQCKGRNRKKNTQCRNAALMEYMGPRPIYCAEHIELDPVSLYEKCKASYQKEPGDNKNCKEVVLKEFGLCYKHYPDIVEEMVRNHNLEKAIKHQQRINELLTQLEREAAAAKKKDGDLYQRKNKLIPKFLEMKKVISKAVELIKAAQVLSSSAVGFPNPLFSSVPNGLDVQHLAYSTQTLSSDDGTDNEEKQLEGDSLEPSPPKMNVEC